MKTAMLIATAALAVASTDAAAGWISCAKEGAYCKFEGWREVAYGAGDRWVSRQFTEGVNCSSDKFGGDPAPGVSKSCRVRDEVVAKPASGPVKWTPCAKEGGICSFDGRREVTYGAGNRWVRKVFSNGVKCATDKFGSDPAPGVPKTCTVSSLTVADTSPVNASWARCAGEGQACRFSGSRRVAYGAQGRYHYLQVAENVLCGNPAFGDPIPGVSKSCYVQP
jgi:hypothetical protein